MLSLRKKAIIPEGKVLVDKKELEELFSVLRQLADGNYVYTLKVYQDPLIAEGAEAIEKISSNVTATFQEFVLRITRLVSYLIDMDYNQMKAIEEKSQKQTENTEMVAATSEEMLASVSEVTEKVQIVAQQAQSASNLAQNSTDQVEQSTAELQKAADKFQALTANINELLNEMKKIKDVIEFIKNVAGQTNLLALNAAIEAARAGEFGRGFAVVAEEVRKLSINTSTSVEQITGNIERLDSEFTSMVEDVTQAAQQITDSIGKVAQVNELIDGIEQSIVTLTDNFDQVAAITEEQSSAMHSIAEAASQVAEIASSNTDRITQISSEVYEMGVLAEELRKELLRNRFSIDSRHTLELAKTDHLMWKWRIYNMFKGLVQIQPEDVASHHECRLGKWYFGEAQELFKDSPLLAEMDQPHQEVHDAAKRAVESFIQGDVNQAQSALEELEHASEQVIKILDDLITQE